MASYHLPPIETVPKLSVSDRAAILDHLFEPSQGLRTTCDPILRETYFNDYDGLINQVGMRLDVLHRSSSGNDLNTLHEILGSHPRLGEKKVDSAQSQAEQAQLGSHDEAEGKKLMEMNGLYEKTFPGLKYVVFVNGRPRPAILEDMQNRIDRRDIGLERAEAIKAMCDIASDRARKLNQQPADT